MENFQKHIDSIVDSPESSFQNGSYEKYKEHMLNLIQYIHDYLDEDVEYNKCLVSRIEDFLNKSGENNISDFKEFSQKCVDYSIDVIDIMNTFDAFFGEEGWKDHFGYDDNNEEYE